MQLEHVSMSLDDVQFHEDGSITVTFWGIKNDTNRQGFSVTVPKNANQVMDISEVLQLYINKTETCRSVVPGKPLFISLNNPYKGIAADTVGNILETSIHQAGLEGYTAKSFRPTAATRAVEIGVLPETAMQIGRWKTKEVFFNHYVYSRVQKDYNDKFFGQD